MKDEAIKNSIDASVEAKTKELTEALEGAVEGINSWLITLRHGMFTQRPWDAAVTLQMLAESAAKYAVTARAHQAQLTALMCMQEAANAEYPEEEKA